MKKKFAVICMAVVFFTAGFVTWSNLVGANNLTPIEELGKNLFFDKIASPDSMSCATCHAPSTGFTGPIAGINKHGAVYRGAVPQRFGNRKPPSSAYATFSPIFYFDEEDELFIGGNFWDGRATGEILGNPAADQALGPFLNPVEQNNPSKQAVCEQVAASKYAELFEAVWGEGSLDCSEDGVDAVYDQIGLSIQFYEASPEVNQFSSKFDYGQSGLAEFTGEEQAGFELFNGKALCAECHPSEPQEFSDKALFTDFTFDNLGVPKNPENPFYEMDRVFIDGSPINPEGINWIDPGLGGFLLTRPEWIALSGDSMGKHKVPTLRNVDKRPASSFPKAFGHNGSFKSLKSIVHFYNPRDVLPICPDAEFTTEKRALAQNCWPAPEVAVNVNTEELGDLGLSDAEEKAIVAFLKTLSDGFQP